MNRKMINLSVLILIIITCILPVFANNNTEAIELMVDNNIVETNKDFNIPFEINSMEYYPFIYSLDKTRIWFNENIIGEGEFREGYLYSKNLKNGECRLLVNKPV